MIIQFKNRKKEIKEIKDVLNSRNFEFLIVYGRRRIGKTELILNATKNSKRIYYLATGENNLTRFYNVASKYDPNVIKLKKDWEILFDYLKDKTDVIILDEFQNLIKEDKNILHLFQSIVDIILKKSNMKLILLGSSVSMMTSKVLSYQSPLYGRKTESMNLKAISFFDLHDFFPSMNIKKLVEVYGFSDGIPFYLNKICDEFWKWLENEIKKESVFLKDEVDFLMRYEFEDVGTYKLILEAIANGHSKLNNIKNFIKVERTDISPYLRNLIEVDFIERKVPVTENIKSREGRYYLSDNFLKFWFRFIYPNLSSLEEGILNTNTIKKEYNAYLGKIFEEIVKEFVIKSKFFKFDKIGGWWHKDKEIDLIALNGDKEILFVECKWKDNVNVIKILKNLKEKTKYVEWHNNKREEYFCIVAKSFKRKIKEKNLYLFDLKDFEKKF
ncbi:MAG: ATP-binding protein [Nanoarchaeota archaeon]|nr:ATP-binding protein [Nanoarchaeota archaeon]